MFSLSYSLRILGLRQSRGGSNKLNLAYLLANPKELYQVKQIAEVFHKHPETIRRWIKTDKITKPLSINGVYYFKGSDIVDYLNATNEGA